MALVIPSTLHLYRAI